MNKEELMKILPHRDHMLLVDDLGGKAKLCDNVLLCRIAGEGVIFGGDIEAIERLDIAIIVFNV